MNLQIPNKPGLFVEVLATTGRTLRGTRRVYHCRSFQLRVNPKRYTPDQRVRLEEGTSWEIIEYPEVHSSVEWVTVKLSRTSLVGFDDAWPMLSRVILQNFSTPSRVSLSFEMWNAS